ncbi:hypothetical protein M0811_11827 [Anaeramoeba ignava]|uniref:Uncharacterized protein n=1 Tax=Anaeramoeba ignava TaxID=1746090 RepID=A0A9Q0R7Z2_ANAIG|nr:hypothetical protein M0811_11827 [Anaeramoeba ignava]
MENFIVTFGHQTRRFSIYTLDQKIIDSFSLNFKEIYQADMKLVDGIPCFDLPKKEHFLIALSRLIQWAKDFGFTLTNHNNIPANFHGSFMTLSEGDPKLIEAIIVKLKEMFNANLEKAQGGGYLLKVKSFLTTLILNINSKEIFKHVKITGFELIQFTCADHETYS